MFRKSKKTSYFEILKTKVENGETLTDNEIRTLSARGVNVDGAEKAWESARKSTSAITEESNGPKCPICHSGNIQLLGQNKKGFSIGKAAGGALLTGGIGLLAGFAGKKGQYEWICMNCSNRFKMK